jgi:hypothetical protein
MPAGYFVDGKLTYKPLVSVVTEFGTGAAPVATSKTLAVIGKFPFLQEAVPYVFRSRDAFLAAAPASGDMRDLASMIYNPSSTAPFNGSPSLVIMINAQPSTQAAGYLKDLTGGNVIKISPLVWGPQGNGSLVRITDNTADETYTIFVSNRSVSEEFTANKGLNALTLAYEYDGTVAAGQAYGFDDSGNGSCVLKLVKEFDENEIKLTFDRTLTQAVAKTALADNKSWIPDSPVSGIITVTKPTGAQTITGDLSVWVVGNDADGISAEVELEFLEAEVEGAAAVTKSTPVFSSVSHVTIVANGWTGSVKVAGTGARIGPAFGHESVSDAISVLNELGGFTADTESFRPGSLELAELDPAELTITAAVTDGLDATRFLLLEAFRLYCTLVGIDVLNKKSIDLPTGGVTVGVILGGGTEGDVNLSSWVAALESLRTQPVTVLVPYTNDEDSHEVHKAAFAHAKFMWGRGQREMQLVIPPQNDQPLSTLNTLRRAYADFRVTVLPHSVSFTKSNGTASGHETRYLALMFAAMQCAAPEIGTPLGGARPNVLSFKGHSSIIGYDAADTLLANGFTALEDMGDGIKVTRWVTTYGESNDPTRTEGGAVECIVHSNIRVREALRPLLNRKASPDFAGTIANVVSSELARQSGGVVIRTWYPETLQVQESNGSYSVRYSISPMLPVNNIAVTAVVIAVPTA